MFEGRHAQDELAAESRPVAPGLDAPPVEFHQATHQGQADAQSALGSVERAVDLREQVEHLREHLGGMPMPVSRTRNTASPAVASDGELDPPPSPVYFAALFRTFERTWESRTWSASIHTGSAGSSTAKLGSSASINGRLVSTAWDNDLSDVDRLFAELDLAAGDPRDVEQVVDQADHLLHLAGDHVARPAEVSAVQSRLLKDLDGVADRGQGVAELVGEHRQEFVLPAVVLLDVAVEPRVVDGDRGAAGEVLGEG